MASLNGPMQWLANQEGSAVSPVSLMRRSRWLVEPDRPPEIPEGR